MYYVYTLIDPRNDLPFYVGKGKGRRMYHHVKCVKRGVVPNKNKKLYNKIYSILSEGHTDVLYRVEPQPDETSAFERETTLIASFGVESLCNISFGGIGGDCITNHPDKDGIYARRDLVPWNKGKRNVYSPETLQQMRNSCVGRPPNAGSFQSGELHRDYGTKQSKERIEKRVRSLRENGMYESLKTTMRGNTRAKTRQVLQLDETGNVVAEYTSISEAAKQTNIPHYRIRNVLTGKQHRTGGYTFTYK